MQIIRENQNNIRQLSYIYRLKAEIKKFYYAVRLIDTGVADGARTHDNRNHNPGLYQLSYSHHRDANYWSARQESNL